MRLKRTEGRLLLNQLNRQAKDDVSTATPASALSLAHRDGESWYLPPVKLPGTPPLKRRYFVMIRIRHQPCQPTQHQRNNCPRIKSLMKHGMSPGRHSPKPWTRCFIGHTRSLKTLFTITDSPRFRKAKRMEKDTIGAPNCMLRCPISW